MGRTIITFVLFFLATGLFGQTDTPAEWSALYNVAYTIDSAAGATSGSGSGLQMWEKAKSNGGYQEHYYLAWQVRGIIDHWRAMGVELDLWRALKLTYHIMEEAVLLSGSLGNLPNNTYQGWPGIKGTPNDLGVALWESYYWRYVSVLLRVMYDSPILLASTHNGDASFAGTTYQDVFDDILAFLETHIWEKWDDTNNTDRWFFRSRIHMCSHWGTIAMNLHYVTRESRYLEVFDQQAFEGFPVTASDGPNCYFRNQFYNVGINYSWYQTFSTDGSGNPGTLVQDTGHAEAIYNYVVEAYELGYYWNENDVQGMGDGLMNLMWDGSGVTISDFNNNVDGSATSANAGDISSGAVAVARYHDGLMTLIQNEVTSIGTVPNTAFNRRIGFLGSATYAQAIRDDTVSYPELGPSSGPLLPDNTVKKKSSSTLIMN